MSDRADELLSQLSKDPVVLKPGDATIIISDPRFFGWIREMSIMNHKALMALAQLEATGRRKENGKEVQLWRRGAPLSSTKDATE